MYIIRRRWRSGAGAEGGGYMYIIRRWWWLGAEGGRGVYVLEYI